MLKPSTSVAPLFWLCTHSALEVLPCFILYGKLMPGLSHISAFTHSPMHVKMTATEQSLHCAEQCVQRVRAKWHGQD